MNDLENYIAKRKQTSHRFVEGFEKGYHAFKIEVMLKEAHKFAEITQEEQAKQKSRQSS